MKFIISYPKEFEQPIIDVIEDAKSKLDKETQKQMKGIQFKMMKRFFPAFSMTSTIEYSIQLQGIEVNWNMGNFVENQNALKKEMKERILKEMKSDFSKISEKIVVFAL